MNTTTYPELREDAIRLGLMFYMGEVQCKHGAVGPRYVSKRACACVDCKEERRLFTKAYREGGKGDGAARGARPREKRMRIGVEAVEYPKLRADAIRLGFSRYIGEVPCKYGSMGPRYVSTRQCTCDHCKEEESRKKREHRARGARPIDVDSAIGKNPRRAAATAREISYIRRKLREARALPKWFGEFDELVIIEANDLSRRREDATGIKWSVDHLIPIQAQQACGLHCASNISVIPLKMNMQKGNRMKYTEPFEWLR
jgi:hypothetical protein